ncbi:MAG TPA: bifunctional precorrin-2 dehydrogenase/sirohydrochlorin ferrochelatase [Acidimicrobiales bacterium]
MDDPVRYPVLLDLRGAPCLVVGGGAVAGRKVDGLRASGAKVTVVAPEVGEVLSSLAALAEIIWQAGPYEPGLAADARWRFVVAATDDQGVNRQVVADATAAGVWANDAGDPSGGPAARPAVHREGPITVTVSTDGLSPAAAAWLRDQIPNLVGREHATLVALLGEARKQASRDGRDVPNATWQAALDSGMLDLIRRGRISEAKERLQACLSSSSD